MHFVKDVKYLSEYKLLLTFEDESLRQVDLAQHLDGEVFEPLKDIGNFKSVHLNSDLDTIAWKMAPTCPRIFSMKSAFP